MTNVPNTYACNLMVGQSQVFTISVVTPGNVAVAPASGNVYSAGTLPAAVGMSFAGNVVTVTALATGVNSVQVVDSEGDTAAVIVCDFTPAPVVVQNEIALTAGAVTGV